MGQETLHDNDSKPVVRHRKPRHFAEKLEGYVGVSMVVVAGVLLAMVLFAFTQTGSGAPAWMPQ